MEEKISKLLKICRGIEPSGEFKERSRRLILTTRPRRLTVLEIIKQEVLENLKFSLALGLASVLVFIMLGGINRGNREQASNIGGAELLSEIRNVDFQIQLGEAEYFAESAEEIAALLGEIKETDDQINTVLDQIIF